MKPNPNCNGLCNKQKTNTTRRAKLIRTKPETIVRGVSVTGLNQRAVIYMERENKKRERGERNARRSCGWDGAAESRSKPSAVWAPPPGDTDRGGENARAGKTARQDEEEAEWMH